jgi:hypothetical protein
LNKYECLCYSARLMNGFYFELSFKPILKGTMISWHTWFLEHYYLGRKELWTDWCHLMLLGLTFQNIYICVIMWFQQICGHALHDTPHQFGFANVE